MAGLLGLLAGLLTALLLLAALALLTLLLLALLLLVPVVIHRLISGNWPQGPMPRGRPVFPMKTRHPDNPPVLSPSLAFD
jgi:hypothetical protein